MLESTDAYVPHVKCLGPGKVAHVCSPSTQEVKDRGSGFKVILGKFEANLGHIAFKQTIKHTNKHANKLPPKRGDGTGGVA